LDGCAIGQALEGLQAMLVVAAMRHKGLGHWLTVNESFALWLTGVATAGLAIGVIFAWFALRDARQTRHAQLLSDFSLRWDSRAMNRSAALGGEFGPEGLVKLSNKIYGPDNEQPPLPPAELDKWKANLRDWYTVIAWPNLLETIGVMVNAGALPRRLVYRLWGSTIVSAWDRDWRLAAVAHRERLGGDTNIFEYFEWLAEQMSVESELDRLQGVADRRSPVGAAISAAASQDWAGAAAGTSS
jgi:hypothetical protein